MAGQVQRRFQQRRGVQIIADKRAEQAHLFFHQRALVAVREHRVEVDHLRRLALPGAHQLDGVAVKQLHLRGNRRDIAIQRGAGQAVFQQGGDQRLTLDQGHAAAQTGQHKGITTQTSRGIQHPRPHARLHAHRLGDHLPAAAAEQPAMGHRTLDEIHPHRPRRLRPQLDQLQPLLAQLQGKLRLALLRQPQALGPGSRVTGQVRSQGVHANCGARPLVIHRKICSKSIQLDLYAVDRRDAAFCQIQPLPGAPSSPCLP